MCGSDGGMTTALRFGGIAVAGFDVPKENTARLPGGFASWCCSEPALGLKLKVGLYCNAVFPISLDLQSEGSRSPLRRAVPSIAALGVPLSWFDPSQQLGPRGRSLAPPSWAGGENGKSESEEKRVD